MGPGVDVRGNPEDEEGQGERRVLLCDPGTLLCRKKCGSKGVLNGY